MGMGGRRVSRMGTGAWGRQVPSDGGDRRLGGRRGRRAARVAHGALRSALVLHGGRRGLLSRRVRRASARAAGAEVVSPDEMLLAVRAITCLCYAMPCAADTVVRHRLLPVLCSRLLAIEYLDVAEQCLQAFEKISLRQPAQCLQAGMITVVLVYMDFVSASIQRVVVSAVANACKKLLADCSQFVMDSVPMLCNLLQSKEKMVSLPTNLTELACIRHVHSALLKAKERLTIRTRRSSVMDLHGSVIEGWPVSSAYLC
ncbi:hypothetical protein ACQJBY_044523 [Aegilops geniculata]